MYWFSEWIEVRETLTGKVSWYNSKNEKLVTLFVKDIKNKFSHSMSDLVWNQIITACGI